jgi:hypothetical protein
MWLVRRLTYAKYLINVYYFTKKKFKQIYTYFHPHIQLSPPVFLVISPLCHFYLKYLPYLLYLPFQYPPDSTFLSEFPLSDKVTNQPQLTTSSIQAPKPC